MSRGFFKGQPFYKAWQNLPEPNTVLKCFPIDRTSLPGRLKLAVFTKLFVN